MKNITNIILIVAISLFSLEGYAQDKTKAKDIRYTVGVKELSYENAAYGDYVAQITENIATNLKLTNRANVVIAKSAEAVEDVLAENIVADDLSTYVTASAGFVKYTLHGSINSIKFIKMGAKGYKSVISFTVRVIENKTTDVVAQQDFKSGGAEGEIARAAAFPSALKTTNEAQQEFFKTFFNLRTTILKIDDASKTSAKYLTITAGRTSGLTKKDQFTVKHIEEVDGFEIETEIATLKIKEIGSTTTKCQVTKGGKDVLSLFDRSNRESLICELKVKKK
jgi:hypothetical protein